MRLKRVKQVDAGATNVISGDGRSKDKLYILKHLAKQKFLLVVVCALIVTGAAVLGFTEIHNKNKQQTPPQAVELSSADELAQAKLPDDMSSTDKSRYYQTVAAAYQPTDKKKALEYLLLAEKLTPNDKDLLYGIAETYFELGDTTNQAVYEQKSGKMVDTRPIGSGGCDISENTC